MDALDGMLEAERKAQAVPQWRKWKGREAMPGQIRDLMDTFVKVSKIEPGKKDLDGWLQEGQAWIDAHLTSTDIEKAYEYANRPDGFLVSCPMSLTKTAIGIHNKPAPVTTCPSVQATAAVLDQPAKPYVPPPPEFTEALARFKQKHFVGK